MQQRHFNPCMLSDKNVAKGPSSQPKLFSSFRIFQFCLLKFFKHFSKHVSLISSKYSKIYNKCRATRKITSAAHPIATYTSARLFIWMMVELLLRKSRVTSRVHSHAACTRWKLVDKSS